MANINSSNNLALSPVAPNERVFGFFQHASLWFSLGVGLLVMQIGAYLVPAVGPRAVLVCDTPYKLEHMGQLYRDRADCENGFDEIKNQWGWGGYSTQDIERSALSARAVALIYNWWSWYVRLANPKNRMEAITSRPKLLSAVGRLTNHAGQSKILLTVMHESVEQIKQLVANVRSGIQHIAAAAPQLVGPQRWVAMVRFIVGRILAAQPRATPVPAALQSG